VAPVVDSTAFQVAEPNKGIKRPSKKIEMFFIRFYGTGD